MADKNTVIEEEAKESSIWKYTLKKPVSYNSEEITELEFDFDKLTGKDALEVENELMRLGKLAIYTQLQNINYIMAMAARACTKPIGTDLFAFLSIADYNEIRNKTQLFLLGIRQ